eukprot:scaffold46657_cov71-Phaeocystis_antarctica.AAC.2
MAYTAGSLTNLQASQTGPVTATAAVIPGVTYHVKTEILRNDLGDGRSEMVTSILVDGVELGGCNPDGGDYDCTFFDCFSAQSHTVTATSTQLQFALSYQGHSWDCDCDTTTWESGDTSCSKESTIAGRSPMAAVARFTLTPVHKLSSFVSTDASSPTYLGAGSDARLLTVVSAALGGPAVNSGTPVAAEVQPQTASVASTASALWNICIYEGVYFKAVQLLVTSSGGSLYATAVKAGYTSGGNQDANGCGTWPLATPYAYGVASLDYVITA